MFHVMRVIIVTYKHWHIRVQNITVPGTEKERYRCTRALHSSHSESYGILRVVIRKTMVVSMNDKDGEIKKMAT